MNRPLNILIAGGGTGGHIFPAVAVANALRRLQPACNILFVGAQGKMEMEKVPQAGYDIKGLDIAGFNRTHWWKNLTLPWKLLKSFWQVQSIFKAFRPDAVFGVGGYSSYPVLKTAQAKGIPTFLHESNAFAGKANTMLGRRAAKVFVAVEGMQQFFPADRLMLTGNPVRSEIQNINIDAASARRFFHLAADKLTLLVIGGSLGARSINEAVHSGLAQLLAADIQVLWQTGKAWQQTATNQQVSQHTFIADMDKAYAAADMVISRAGAMSVAELCMVGKPAVFVPFPFAAEDHQTANAMALVNKHAAIIVKDADAAAQLVPAVLALAADAGKRQQMASNMAAQALRHADEVIAKTILKSVV
ncbi:MAG: undecaprenyldiphospho-muramoylpentapeptide beta-N-acetylglucosaminyltransferase [Chitinophagaceae bacterium]|nr:undecaprenyldiphospho-muramoylpentapeptide beta-N-acetylglucosaminyltransferase [Chitinophagaceae bacterium]